ncbi:hypothetical protein G7054_g11725 [Neopestalotiopsis clavispora]|nr:hypothetical protein G7054_g11725 [Neopestalotiopsis clavispora]
MSNHSVEDGPESPHARAEPLGLASDALEQHIRECEEQEVEIQTNISPSSNGTKQTNEGVAYDILSLLAKELPKIFQRAANGDSLERPAKKRKVAAEEEPTMLQTRQCRQPDLPPGIDLLEPIINAYFTQVHHWIPMVHQGRFRRRLKIPGERDHLELLIHAMALSTARYIHSEQAHSSCDASSGRDWIVSSAISRPSVESMQALIIVAFNDIGCGNGEKAWSIVGSLTRTIEYMQLTIEQSSNESSDGQSLCRPYQSINPIKDWTELEERRRVFWNVMSLDRFCSVTMGWNTSLTSNDVHRRLPCDGMYWRKEQHVTTPFLGIWDKSSGRIGNPIAFMATSHQAADKPLADMDTRSQAESTSTAGGTSGQAMDTSTIGAYAYCLEASESMSHVTSYFLQQKVNMQDIEEINMWLTRFKELDLRLVHWKMLLPTKWKANVTLVQSPRMDPNLTLAHVTHNASMIMLHQPIAYPSPIWGFRNRLPSSCSADTCYSAGVEIATITQNYLRIVKASPLAPQYAFCLYIAARMFLVHWRYYVGNPLGEEFWFLVQSLAEFSHRWSGIAEPLQPQTQDLAGKYALKLRELHRWCAQNDSFRLNPMDYTSEIEHGSNRPASTVPNENEDVVLVQESFTQARHGVNQWMAYASVSTQQPQSNQVNGAHLPMQNHPDSLTTPLTPSFPTVGIQAMPGGSEGMNSSETNSMQHILLDSQFVNLDRVITYDDGSLFAADLDGGSW